MGLLCWIHPCTWPKKAETCGRFTRCYIVLYRCWYIYIYICVCARARVCVCVCECVWFVCVCDCVYVCVRAHECVYVCVIVCMWVWLCVCVIVCMWVCDLCVCVIVYMCVCVCARVCVCMCVYVSVIVWLCVCECVWFVCVIVYVCVCECVSVWLWVCVCAWVCVWVSVCVVLHGTWVILKFSSYIVEIRELKLWSLPSVIPLTAHKLTTEVGSSLKQGKRKLRKTLKINACSCCRLWQSFGECRRLVWICDCSCAWAECGMWGVKAV